MVSASSLLLPSSLRDLASCASSSSLRVVACATPSSTLTSTSSTSTTPRTSSSSTSSPSTLSVTVSYRTTPQSPSSPPLLLRLTWYSHTTLGPPTLSFAGPTASSPAVLLRRRKGTRSLLPSSDTSDSSPHSQSHHPAIALFWDLTAARYGDGSASPEPVSGFYVVAVADAEVVLAVGDLAAEFVKAKFEGQILKARSILPVSRTHRVVVAAPGPRTSSSTTTSVHAAKVRFAEGAPEHEVAVGCSRCGSTRSSGDQGEEELWVSVDGKRAVHARRLRWNFRGNQTVFVDGAPVDVLWDLHGWWFRDPPGCAVVMLRARTALENRLWIQEEEEAQAPAFALLVQAFKSPP